MNATGLLRQAKADGVRISLNHDGTLDYRAPRAMDARWLPLLREHKAEIVALLAATMDTQRWWQGSIEGRSVQPQPHAAAVLGHKAPAMTAEADDLLDTPKAHKPDILAAPAHPNVSGVSPEFVARLSAEDLENIAAGDIPVGTVQAFEQAAIAREAEDLEEFFEERSAILELDAGVPRPDAELEAARITATRPGIEATCGPAYVRRWRATPSCSRRCRIGRGRWTPYCLALPRSRCSRAGA
jgi:proteasome lid subunit RPN8/RPN11